GLAGNSCTGPRMPTHPSHRPVHRVDHRRTGRATLQPAHQPRPHAAVVLARAALPRLLARWCYACAPPSAVHRLHRESLAVVPLSLLDLAPATEGSTIAQAFANTLDLARHAERLGYQRFWLAEHHNMPGIASAATAVLIGHVAGGTRSIRVGAGGV